MSYEEVLDNLKKVFEQRYKINLDEYDGDVVNKHLLGSHFRLLPSDLLYLFFDIEREFEIQIPEDEIAQGNFDTLHNIATIILTQLKEVI